MQPFSGETVNAPLVVHENEAVAFPSLISVRGCRSVASRLPGGNCPRWESNRSKVSKGYRDGVPLSSLNKECLKERKLRVLQETPEDGLERRNGLHLVAPVAESGVGGVKSVAPHSAGER